jgi:hypothetical protein
MSEEETNDGTLSGLKKTLIGTISTAVLAGGTWFTTTLFGGGEEPKEETKTEQPAAAPVVVNVQQTQDNKQKVDNGGGTVSRERVIEKPAATQPAAPVQKPQEESW